MKRAGHPRSPCSKDAFVWEILRVWEIIRKNLRRLFLMRISQKRFVSAFSLLLLLILINQSIQFLLINQSIQYTI